MCFFCSECFTIDEDNSEFAQRLRLAMDEGDRSAIHSVIADDCVLQISGSPEALPFAGTYTKADVIAGRVPRDDEYCEVHSLQMNVWLREPNRKYAVLCHKKATVHSTQKSFEHDYVVLIEVAEGKLKKWQQFHDTHDLVRAFS